MSDHQSKENLSAWIDGELDHARASALPNQILQSAEMRQSWSEWHLVGDLMRSAGAARQSTLTKRIVEQIKSEPVHLPSRNPRPSPDVGAGPLHRVEHVLFMAPLSRLQSHLSRSLPLRRRCKIAAWWKLLRAQCRSQRPLRSVRPPQCFSRTHGYESCLKPMGRCRFGRSPQRFVKS